MPLTLPDRDALVERLDAVLGAEAAARGTHVAVLRLRKLAAIRRMGGEAAVAHTVETVASRLAGIVRPGDFLARLGEGEYGLVFRDGDGDEDLIERTIAVASQPVAFADVVLYAPANAGVCALEASGATAHVFVERAMRALERAMASGPGAVEWVSEARAERAAAEWEMASLLEEATLRGEMSLEYHAAHTATGAPLLKSEALLRWDSPAMGRVSPQRFIPMLEESGLIRTVGEWVLRQACLQLRAWRVESGLPLRVAVNVSPVQMTSDFERIAERTLAETSCDPGWIELEVTEGALIRNFERVRARLEALAAMGFELAIDDFGAGYSSLGQLAQLPVHHLKMDRSLVAGLPAGGKRSGVVKAVIALAEALELGVTAEGVERPEQAQWLARFPGIACQGFLFSRPMPAADLLRMIGSRRAGSPGRVADPRGG